MGVILDRELQAVRLCALETQLDGLAVRVPEAFKIVTRGDVDMKLFARLRIAHEVARKVSSGRSTELACPRRDNVNHRRTEFLCDAATAIKIFKAPLSFFHVSAGQPFYYRLEKWKL